MIHEKQSKEVTRNRRDERQKFFCGKVRKKRKKNFFFGKTNKLIVRLPTFAAKSTKINNCTHTTATTTTTATATATTQYSRGLDPQINGD